MLKTTKWLLEDNSDVQKYLTDIDGESLAMNETTLTIICLFSKNHFIIKNKICDFYSDIDQILEKMDASVGLT